MKPITSLLLGLSVLYAASSTADEYTKPMSEIEQQACHEEEEITEASTLDEFLGTIEVPQGSLPPEPPIVTDPIENLAFTLRDYGVDVDGKGLVTVLRVMYLEGAGERDPVSDLVIAASIVNRYNFDKEHPIESGEDYFGGKEGLIGVVTKPHQYSAYNEALTDFSDDSYHFENGNLRFTSKRVEDERRVQDLAAALFNIATRRVKDPTNGALYYKKEKVETSWGDGTLALYWDNTPCHHEELTDLGVVGGHVVFGVKCE